MPKLVRVQAGAFGEWVASGVSKWRGRLHRYLGMAFGMASKQIAQEAAASNSAALVEGP
jgi:hypothetical protein